jgi:hypothetical protein
MNVTPRPSWGTGPFYTRDRTDNPYGLRARRPSRRARACKTAGCALPAHPRHRRCAPCTAVHGATFALYWALIERDGARLEAETPGFIDATRRALATPHPAGDVLDPAGPPVRRLLEHSGVAIDWQVERLEAFIGELRTSALLTEAPA